MELSKLKQFISSLKLTPDIKLFGVRFGVAGHEFGAVNVNDKELTNSSYDIPTSNVVKQELESRIKSGVPVNAVVAKSTLTLDESSQVLIEGVAISIGSYNYIIRDVLSDPIIAGEVLSTESDELTLVNLKNAINGLSGYPAHPFVIATDITPTTLVIEARSAGSSANSIPIAPESLEITWDGSTLGGTVLGVDGTIGKAGDIYISENLQSLYIAFANNTSNTGNWVNIYNKS